MVGLLFSLVVAAAPAPKLAFPDVSVVHIDTARRTFFGEHFAQQLKLLGAQVITDREIATILGLERQRELLGCADNDSTCDAEIADALGASGVVLVSLARFDDDAVQINLKVITSGQGRTLAAWSERVPNLSQVAEALTRAAPLLLAQTYRSLGVSPPAALVFALKSPLEKHGWIPGAVGLAAAGVGLGLYLSALGDYQALTVPGPTPLTPSQAVARRDAGKFKEPLGVGLLIGGGVAVAGSAVLWLVGRANPVEVPPLALVPTRDGAVLVAGGTF